MAAKTLENRINTESFSHASGSVPAKCMWLVVSEFFFPRKWECSQRKNQDFPEPALFPTQVGVFLCLQKMCRLEEAFSHASGSIPSPESVAAFMNIFFPRKWECSLDNFCRKKFKRTSFPAFSHIPIEKF